MNRPPFRQLALVIFLLALAWRAPPAAADTHSDNAPDASAIKAAAARWADAYNRGDLDAVADMYTPDARLLPQGSEAIVGRTAILDYFRKMRASRPPQSLSFSNFEFYGRDPVVTEYSEIEIRDQSGNIASRSKQVLIRMKQEGQWKIHRDIWTTNGPARAN